MYDKIEKWQGELANIEATLSEMKQRCDSEGREPNAAEIKQVAQV